MQPHAPIVSFLDGRAEEFVEQGKPVIHLGLVALIVRLAVALS